MDDLQPSAIPVSVTKRREALTLYQIAVLALAIIAGLTVGGGIVLAFFGQAIPESLIALGGVAVGALAGMVAPERGQ